MCSALHIKKKNLQHESPLWNPFKQIKETYDYLHFKDEET